MPAAPKSKQTAKDAIDRDFIRIPQAVLPAYTQEADRLGCDRKQLFRAALKHFTKQFPLKKELVLT